MYKIWYTQFFQNCDFWFSGISSYNLSFRRNLWVLLGVNCYCLLLCGMLTAWQTGWRLDTEHWLLNTEFPHTTPHNLSFRRNLWVLLGVNCYCLLLGGMLTAWQTGWANWVETVTATEYWLLNAITAQFVIPEESLSIIWCKLLLLTLVWDAYSMTNWVGKLGGDCYWILITEYWIQ